MLEPFNEIYCILPDFFRRSNALLGSGDFFLKSRLLISVLSLRLQLSFRFWLSFKVFLFLCSFCGLWLLFCLRVIEFFSTFLLLDRLFLQLLRDVEYLEEIYFSLRSVTKRKSSNLPIIIFDVFDFFKVLSFCVLISCSKRENEEELPILRDLSLFSSCSCIFFLLSFLNPKTVLSFSLFFFGSD